MTLPSIRRIVFVNPKGGSGKTTLATNLAACYAERGMPPALLDLDAQGSGTAWLEQRPADRPPIHGITGWRTPPGVTRSYAQRIPPHVQRVVVDTAAALDRHALAEVTRGAHKIVVPVLPSEIDIQAASRTLRDLLLTANVSLDPCRLAVVANRVRANTRGHDALMRFLARLAIPVAAVIRDTQHYVRAAQEGLGVHELPGGPKAAERAQWEALLRWIESDEAARVPDPGKGRQTVQRTGAV